jgi:hypothetical protein
MVIQLAYRSRADKGWPRKYVEWPVPLAAHLPNANEPATPQRQRASHLVRVHLRVCKQIGFPSRNR